MDAQIERASYAAVHQAISGLVNLVCIVDRLRQEEWKGTEIGAGDAIELTASEKFGDHVAITRWRVIGPVRETGPVHDGDPELSTELVLFMKGLWPVADWWLNKRDRIWWFRAELIADDEGWRPTPDELVAFLTGNRRAFGLPKSPSV
jgi:hypothetical protein